MAAPEEVDADAVLWAASMTANTELAARAGLDLDTAGRIRVDAALRSTSHPEIYAAGDFRRQGAWVRAALVCAA
ncbi:FAD-dependent oxidoreductase [Streptomyces sp. NPDC000941]